MPGGGAFGLIPMRGNDQGVHALAAVGDGPSCMCASLG
jgi:hypothetical protein